MASIGKLIAAVAAAEGMDEGSVKLIARYAREAGHISQGTYGPGAAKMTVSDAANLIIAVNASDSAKSSSSTIDLFRNLRSWRAPTLAEPGCDYENISQWNLIGTRLSAHCNFGDLLEALLIGCSPSTEPLSFYDDETLISVKFSRPIFQASVYIRGDLLPAYYMNTFSETAIELASQRPNRIDETTISGEVLRRVASVIFE